MQANFSEQKHSESNDNYVVMKRAIQLIAGILMLVTVLNIQAGTITINKGDFGTETSYFKEEKEITVGGIKYGACYINPSTGQMNNGGFFLYNKDPMPGEISQVIIYGTTESSKSLRLLQVRHIYGKEMKLSQANKQEHLP